MSLCTMFAFEGVEDPNLLHCTHKYFGDGTASREQVIQELEAHFAEKPFKSFQVPFTQLDQFGPEKDYRVLRPESSDAFLPDLKAKLDQLEPDKFSEYRPHVTVGRNTDALDKPIRDYVLMEDHKPIWSAAQHMSQLESESRERIARAGAGRAGNAFSRRRLRLEA